MKKLLFCLIAIAITAGVSPAFVSTRKVCMEHCLVDPYFPAACDLKVKPNKCFKYRKLIRQCRRFGVDKICPPVVTTTPTTLPVSDVTTTTLPSTVVVVIPGPAGPAGPSGPAGPTGPTVTTTTQPGSPTQPTVTTTTQPTVTTTTQHAATTTTVQSATTTTTTLGDPQHCQFNSDCQSGKCRHRKNGNVCDPR